MARQQLWEERMNKLRLFLLIWSCFSSLFSYLAITVHMLVLFFILQVNADSEESLFLSSPMVSPHCEGQA